VALGAALWGPTRCCGQPGAERIHVGHEWTPTKGASRLPDWRHRPRRHEHPLVADGAQLANKLERPAQPDVVA
jgi:hypothetical protein